ncbi:MAG: ribonuclease III, partial [Deltaproteobacteria bacterium]|nr:ribonuclease III [Deltaproteobacteria bacterium]
MISKEEKKKLQVIEKSLGYSFKSDALLKRALTHKSYANENRLPSEQQNERLEFLGDAVLELAISEFLMEKFPLFSEGDLSKLRAAIVNEQQLTEIARGLNLGEFLYLGRGEEQTSGREKPSLLADAFEALLGAIYLDRGYKKASLVIRKHYGRMLEQSPVESFYRDYKTDLQEKSQALFRSIPKYKLVSEIGPDHSKTFEVEIYIREQLMGKG